ncbi:MAG TPA: hypothetical protein DCM05_10260 [Elusimicrobia bacterium]|nr:hypothetical protein [Elusimicrobiota bacterium]
MKSPLLPALAALALAAPALAQDLGASSKNIEDYFQSGALVEQLIHARHIPKEKDLGGAMDSKTLAGFIPECDEEGVVDLPPKYLREYSISPEDKSKLQRILGAGQKYSDFQKALNDGYVPTDVFEDGLGLAFAKVSLFTDRKYFFDKPDLLFYLKDRAKMAFRLVSVAYVAGDRLPNRDFKITRQKSRELIKLWRPWDGICFKNRKGALSYHDTEDEDAGGCMGGRFIKRAHIMHVWLPLYNPKGLFTPTNPVAEYLDLNNKAFPFCRKKF